MSIVFNAGKEYKKLNKYLNNILDISKNESTILNLKRFGEIGVQELAKATPKDTGLTANSWYYDIVVTEDTTTITWHNSNMSKDWFPVAIMLQYGHATRNGGYVEGNDYINPAMEQVFKNIAEEAWKELNNA